MRIGPMPPLPSNLTIALIERDRANPTPAAHRSQRRLEATRVALSRQARFAPQPIPITAAQCSLTAGHPRELTEAAVTRPPDPSGGPAGEHHPHRIPPCASSYAVYSPDGHHPFAVRQSDRLIDVYA